MKIPDPCSDCKKLLSGLKLGRCYPWPSLIGNEWMAPYLTQNVVHDGTSNTFRESYQQLNYIGPSLKKYSPISGPVREDSRLRGPAT